MNNRKSRLDDLMERLRATQQELEQEWDRVLAERRARFHYTLRKGRVVFERRIRSLQLNQRTRAWRYLRDAPFSHILVAPIIYGMVVPLALLDLTITLYQHVCFRAYKIPRVKRSAYFVIDRHHLAYLNTIEKINCVYCGYGNGLIAYAREITARTEQFWCPIKHARRAKGAHSRTAKFVDYGDANAWKEQLVNIRQDWHDAENNSPDHPL